MTQSQLDRLLAELDRGGSPAAKGSGPGEQVEWICQASDDEVERLLSELLTRPLPRADEDALLGAVFRQLVMRARHGQPPPPSQAASEVMLAKVAELYRRLGAASNARAYLLQLLASSRGPAELAALAELLVADPPPEPTSVALACSPLFQHKDYDPAALFPKLWDAISHPSVAVVVVDLANFVTRERLSTCHPAKPRKDQFVTLLGGLVQRLSRFEEQLGEIAGSPQNLAKKVEESVSLAVSLCDALALIGDKAAIGKLYQALELGHRRLRTEAAAALARLGEKAGQEALLAMAAEPAARLRVLAYARELGLTDKVAADYQTPVAQAEAELALWLAQPSQFGIPPTQLELVDSRRQYWPGFDQPVDCFLFRFTYRLAAAEYSSLGIAGPLTYAFAADLADLPPDDIYAAFAGWHAEHEEIGERDVEELSEAQQVDVARLARRLQEAGYDAIQPVTLGRFFDEQVLTARATRNNLACVVVAGTNELLSYRSPQGARSIGPQEAWCVYKGRKILSSFNP